MVVDAFPANAELASAKYAPLVDGQIHRIEASELVAHYNVHTFAAIRSGMQNYANQRKLNFKVRSSQFGPVMYFQAVPIHTPSLGKRRKDETR